tara:strand:- start:505 stop:1161 length:657 start_codon:yes stop_codon:yes gene_type:complete
MKIDFFLNHKIGLFVLDEISIENTGSVITYDEEIAKKAKSKGFSLSKGHENLTDFSKIGFSIHYPKIFDSEFIGQYEKLYNLHPSFLPWGRGRHPAFWALWNNEPAGATIHEINKELDKGPIVMQKKANKARNETGYEIFQKVDAIEKELLKMHLGNLEKGVIPCSFPQKSEGSYHQESEIYALKKKDFWSTLSDSEVKRLYRCLEFPGQKNLEDYEK